LPSDLRDRGKRPFRLQEVRASLEQMALEESVRPSGENPQMKPRDAQAVLPSASILNNDDTCVSRAAERTLNEIGARSPGC
jgi:hypothetical protein